MAVTARELKRQQKRARQDRERDLRKKDRAQLRELRKRLAHARQHRSIRIREIKLACKRARLANKDRARAIREAHRAAAKAEIAAMRANARTSCEANTAAARGRGTDSIERAARALDSERRHQSTVRRYSKPSTLAKSAAAIRRRRAAEPIHESDSEVANNIPAELLPVWERVRGQIRESPRRTRTEAFLEWVHDHAGDVFSILEDSYARDVAQMVEREAELRSLVDHPSHYRHLAAELDPVPF